MEQNFFYTREGIPSIPAEKTRDRNTQIAGDYTLPRIGSPIKMAAVDPDLQLAYPELWWKVPRENYENPEAKRRRRKRSSSTATCLIVGLLVIAVGILILPAKTPP